jgi:uncharacterized membrane protein
MSKQHPSTSTTREEKRSQFTDNAGKKNTRAIVIAVLVLAGGGTAAYFALGSASDRPVVITEAPKAGSAPAQDVVRVSVNDVGNGRAKFFDYKLPNNQDVRFFVVKSSQGDYRVALDACEVCAHAKLGYHQEGDDMVCNNCSKRFPTALIGKISGGCHPVALPATVEGDNIVVKKSEVEAGAKYFF